MQRKKHNTKYSPEFKISVIMDMRENHLGYRETARKYKLGNSVCQGKNLAIKWERIYLEEGAEGLMEERRGRKSAGRPRKKPLLPEAGSDLLDEAEDGDQKADRARSRCRRKSRTISLPRTKD